MSTREALLVLLLCLIGAATVAMLLERRTPLADRLRRLDTGGDSWGVALIAGAVGLGIGSVVGSVIGHGEAGAVVGLVTGASVWLVAVAFSVILWLRERGGEAVEPAQAPGVS